MRAHANVEDYIGRLKDSGLERFPFTDLTANADFHAANSTQLLGVFEVEGAAAPPGDDGVGDVGPNPGSVR
jgi:hypothetical protein